MTIVFQNFLLKVMIFLSHELAPIVFLR